MNQTRRLLVFALAATLGATIAAPAEAAEGERPRVGLVLAGGGARGAAHVGVIEVLEKNNIPVDFIVGSSMGAIVGGLYASGVSPEAMRQRLTELDWGEAFDDEPVRKRMPFRRKQDDLLPLFGIEFGFGKDGLSTASGFVAGQKLNFILRSMLLHAPPGSFDDLPIPFRATAVDLETAELVVLDHGDLAMAVRASMAFPMMFTPVEIDGRTLVDGGVLRNIPVDIALEMGADVIIVVDVSSPLKEPKKENLSAFGVTKRTVSLMSSQNKDEQMKLMREHDVLLTPDLEGITFTSFELTGDAIDRGVDVAELQVEELRKLAVPEEEFQAYRDRQRAGTQVKDLVVDYIRVEGADRLSPKLISKRIHTEVGEPLDLDVVRRDLERVYKIGEFENVGFSLERAGDRVGLVVTATEKSWGPWYFRPGAAIQTDLQGSGEFVATSLFRRPHLNRLAAEWKSFVTLGSSTIIFSELFQPVEFTGRFFVAPNVLILDNEADTIYLDGAEVTVENRFETGSFDVGALISNSGEVRLGVVGGKYLGQSEFLTEDPEVDLGAIRFRAALDRVDNATFPKDGVLAFMDLLASRESLGADDEFERLTVNLSYFGSVGRYTVGLTARGGSDLGSDVPYYADFGLGGFLNLSGLGTNELTGQQMAFGRLMVYRTSGKLEKLLGGSKYIGLSLETGNAWKLDEAASFSDLRMAGSLWFGMDSLLGPIYAGYGLTDGGEDSFYLFLGRVFGPRHRF